MYLWKPLMVILLTLISTFLLVIPVDVTGDKSYFRTPWRSGNVKSAAMTVEGVECDPKAEQVIRKAFEDNSWLALSSEEELRRYCEDIYCPETAKEMAAKLYAFLEENNDWHTGARVRSIKRIGDSGEIKVKVMVEYLELAFSDTSKLSFVNTGEDRFIVSLEGSRLEGYKIREISRLGEEKNN